jgi:hypothetical protein
MEKPKSPPKSRFSGGDSSKIFNFYKRLKPCAQTEESPRVANATKRILLNFCDYFPLRRKMFYNLHL